MTNIALSSYWMRGRYERISDFFRVGAELGLSAFEVSGLRIDTFYDEIRPGHFNIVSFHNPAPPHRGEAVMGSKVARQLDLVLTSLDAERREQAVAVVKHCLDVASEYGAQAIVLHPGNTSADLNLENQLKHLHLAGRIASPEADAMRAHLLSERAQGHADRLSALRRSLDELIPYAASRGVRLGLENRPICEVPNFEDMGEILSWYDEITVGYWHDTGHAQVQEALGFTPQADWLRTFGHHLIGAHLHDEANLEVHLAPGEGEVDWNDLATLIPKSVLRVIETNHTVSTESLRRGIDHLKMTGWIQGDYSGLPSPPTPLPKGAGSTAPFSYWDAEGGPGMRGKPMSTNTIRAVAFDMGGTLEDLYYDDASRMEATRGLQQFLRQRDLDPCLPLPDLQATVLAGMKAYTSWREHSEIELSPERVWTEYIFPNHGLPRDRLMAEAEALSFFYDTHFHIRTLRPEAPAALDALRTQGLRLAVISNILSRRTVQVKLEEYGLTHYFDPIMTSSNFGWRKPNERIFLEAARRMGVPPAACAYVGDTISRDVIGAHRAGYGLAIQIKSFLTDKADKETDTEPPDAVIHDLMQVVDLVYRDRDA